MAGNPYVPNPYVPGPMTARQYVGNVMIYIHFALATLAYGIMGIVPVLMRGRKGATWVSVVWLNHLIWAVRFWLRLTCEVRGTPPAGDGVVAAKHQSFWDILSIAQQLPRRAFIMKREVMRVPIMGWYAWKVGCIPIDRTRGKDAMRAISTEISARMADNTLGQVIVYPEGTRTRPGERRAYKHGIATIQQATGLPVVPVAVNCGLFWPKSGWGIRPGRAIIEFLPEITAEEVAGDLIPLLQERIETASDRLMAEAGFVARDEVPPAPTAA